MGTCKDCKWWEAGSGFLRTGEDFGFCTLHSDPVDYWEDKPVSSMVDVGSYDTGSYACGMATYKDFGCNQFEAKS